MKPKQVLDHFKTKAEIARRLGIKPPSVTEWFNNKRIPIRRQLEIQKITRGVLKARI